MEHERDRGAATRGAPPPRCALSIQMYALSQTISDVRQPQRLPNCILYEPLAAGRCLDDHSRRRTRDTPRTLLRWLHPRRRTVHCYRFDVEPARHAPVQAPAVQRTGAVRSTNHALYGLQRLGSRGNMDAFRTLSRPKYRKTTRSRPTPPPPCGGMPCRIESM